jgi:hypothetical protein
LRYGPVNEKMRLSSAKSNLFFLLLSVVAKMLIAPLLHSLNMP